MRIILYLGSCRCDLTSLSLSLSFYHPPNSTPTDRIRAFCSLSTIVSGVQYLLYDRHISIVNIDSAYLHNVLEYIIHIRPRKANNTIPNVIVFAVQPTDERHIIDPSPFFKIFPAKPKHETAYVLRNIDIKTLKSHRRRSLVDDVNLYNGLATYMENFNN